MRLRWLTLALLALVVSAPAFSFDFTLATGGAGGDCTLSRPGTCYGETTSAGGTGAVSVQNCERSTLSLKCLTGSCTAIGNRCPGGVETDDQSLCTADTYQDSSGAVLTALTGNVTLLQDLNEIDPTPSLVVVVTGAARVQVDCR